MSRRTWDEVRVGDRIRFAEERFWYTIQARSARYLVCTRKTPFHGPDCPTYTIVDLVKKIRGPDNMVFCMGYVTRKQCEQRLRRLEASRRLQAYLQRREPNVIFTDIGMTVSRRHRIPLALAGIKEG